MLCEVRSLGLTGISGYEVRAECDLSGGLPAFEIVGLPDAAVKEARDRVRAAIKNCGFSFPVSRITVNLAPADRKKGGTVYDCPFWWAFWQPGNSSGCPPAPAPLWESCPYPVSCGPSPVCCPWPWPPFGQVSRICTSPPPPPPRLPWRLD